MKKHIWTSLALALAMLTYASGIQTLSGNMLAGEVMLLSALACRSANKRRLNEVQSTTTRKLYEFSLIIVLVLLVILQNGLKDLIATDPFPNVVVPFVCLIFYFLAFYKAKSIVKVDEVVEEQ